MITDNITKTVNGIKQHAAVPVFYHPDSEVCKKIIRICYNSGFRIFEFTNRGENAADIFAELKKLVEKEMPDMCLGAGTIFSTQDAEKYIGLKADFIVSPIFNPEVGQYCQKNDLLWVPGCMTTTEIYNAHKAGAKVIKLFPGDVLGLQFLKSIRPVFSSLNFMPTGGVTTDEQNLKAWFDAGVVAVGMGSQLLPKKMIDGGDWDKLGEHVKQAAETVKKIIANK